MPKYRRREKTIHFHRRISPQPIQIPLEEIMTLSEEQLLIDDTCEPRIIHRTLRAVFTGDGLIVEPNVA